MYLTSQQSGLRCGTYHWYLSREYLFILPLWLLVLPLAVRSSALLLSRPQLRNIHKDSCTPRPTDYGQTSETLDDRLDRRPERLTVTHGEPSPGTNSFTGKARLPEMCFLLRSPFFLVLVSLVVARFVVVPSLS